MSKDVAITTQYDAIEYLKAFDPESVDLVVTDPAYESLERHRAIGSKKCRRLTTWFPIFPNERFPELFSEIYRVLANNSHFYMFCDAETMFIVKPMAEKAGFKFWKPLIWDKVQIGMGYHYRNRYEIIMFFEKGKRKLKDLGMADILCCQRITRRYPTQKPVGILTDLISQSSDEGDIVCDPFMGSGSTGIAAIQLRRFFTGNDISETAYKTAKSNLEKLCQIKIRQKEIETTKSKVELSKERSPKS